MWSLDRPKAGLKLRSTNNLVKTPSSTMACHDVGHVCIHQIRPLGMAYFGPVKIQPIYFGLSFGNQFISVAQSCPTATQWTAVRQASLSSTNSRSPPKPMSIVLVMPSNHLILCHPLLLLPSIFPSIRVISNESAFCILLKVSKVMCAEIWQSRF